MKRWLKHLLFGLVVSTALPAAAMAAQDGVEKEIERLRQENEQIKSRLDSIELEAEESRHDLASLSRFVEVGGYADAEFYLTDKDSENSRFRVRHLSLFFIKEVQEDWKLFTEIEYEDAPLIESAHLTDDAATVQGKLFVEQMYIEYHPSLAWNVRFGRFLTPAGIWNIYHYPPYVPTQERPLMVRRIFPQVSDGVQASYSWSLGDNALDTHVYAANGSGNPGRLDRNEEKAFGARVNLDYGPWWAGASAYAEKDNAGTRRAAFGAHLQADYAPLRLQAEYQYRNNDPGVGEGFIDRGFYVQGTYDIGMWTLAARYDWYDPDSGAAGADLFRYTGAVNYHFAHNVIGKAEYNRNDVETGEDYNEAIFSIVVAIGDL